MPHESQLPPVFAQYAGRVRYVQKQSSVRWSSTCVICGGEKHEDGEWPNRCVWWISGKEMGYCFKCHTIFWPDAAPGYKAPTSVELETWRQEREREIELRKARAAELLAHFRHAETWRRYYEALDLTPGRAYWRNRGVPDAWQDYWALGWADNRWTFTLDDGSTRAVSAATIPLFDSQWEVLNVKHRLIDPPAGNGKYRAEISGQPAQPFLCNPTAALTGSVLIIEGEIKAAVVAATLDQEGLPIIGLPGSTPAPHIIAMLKDAERVTLVLDPGAEKAAHDLANAIGRRKCRVLIPPAKIDDMLLASHMTGYELKMLLRQARAA